MCLVCAVGRSNSFSRMVGDEQGVERTESDGKSFDDGVDQIRSVVTSIVVGHFQWRWPSAH